MESIYSLKTPKGHSNTNKIDMIAKYHIFPTSLSKYLERNMIRVRKRQSSSYFKKVHILPRENTDKRYK